mmetsp:Transcript_21945/g.50017  ORF Transcript_21945/g.50017 Transcript_21945/m.50017 type:complete len:161 (-) Transcript_21945:595-1077(-)
MSSDRSSLSADTSTTWEVFRNVRNEAIGGFSAGIIGTFIGFPLDTIKTRMQTDKQVPRTSNFRSLSMVATTRRILESEGWRGFYRGVVPPLVSLSLLNTINFASYAHIREHLNAAHGWDVRNAVAGSIIGPIASIISTVEHMAKVSNISRTIDSCMDQRM